MGSGKRVTVGYKYYFGIHMGLGMPLDELVAIRVGGKEAWRGSVTDNQTIEINQPTLFGGATVEGGIDGTMDVMMGDENQAATPRLVSMLGGLVPAFRGLATAFYDGQISSMTPYPKVWEFLRRGGERLFDGSPWYASRMHIWLAGGQIRAMNPAHILYLVFTSPRFRGISPSRMDDAAWRAAADKLHAEGLGLCLEWRRSDSYSNFVDTVISHIGADIYDDRKTGLISIRLTRDDYNPASLPLFDEDAGLLELNEDTRPSQESAPSELVVTYVDAIDGNQRQVRAVNAAIAARAGGRSAEKVDYPGAPTGEIAARLAQRDLRIKTSSLRRFKVVLDRRGRDIHPGQPFRIRSLRRGIDQIIVRAGRVDDHFLVDGKVVITAIQDVFGLPQTSYIAIPPQGWSMPTREAVPVVNRRMVELTWRDVVSQLDPANVELLDGTEAVLGALAEPPSSMSFNFNIARRVGGSGAFTVGETGDWCPSAVIADAIPRGQSSVTVTLSSASRLELVAVGHAALLNNEILRVSAINASAFTVTLQRGCIDTVPGIHATGSRIWFYDAGAGVDETVWTQGAGLQVKLLTNTSIERLGVSAALTDSITFNGRIGKPYPPARLLINDEVYPSNAIAGEITVTWAHRDRILQADQLIDTSEDHIGPEPGTSYSLRLIRVDTLEQITSVTGLQGSSTVLECPYIGQVQLEAWSTRAGIDSLFRHSHVFDVLDSGISLYVVVPLTYSEEDAENEMTWTRQGSAPTVTPQGFDGDGYGARLISTTIPEWMAGMNNRLAIQATILIRQQKHRSTGSGETVLHLGSNAAGTNPDARLALVVGEETRHPDKVFLGLNVTTSSTLQTIPLFRPEWRYQFRFPKLVVNGQKARPQALLFLDPETILITAHYADTESRAFKVDIYTGDVTGSFTFGIGQHVHVASFATTSSGAVWCVEYIGYKALEIDVAASLATGNVQITKTVDLSAFTGPSSLEMVTVGGTEYVLMGEYATSGSPLLYVFPLSSWVDSAVLSAADRFKRFDIGQRNQGTAIKDGALYVSRNRLQGSSILYGSIELYDDIANSIINATDGSTLTSTWSHSTPSRFPEDIKFHPVTGDLWTMTEGWDAVVDFDGWLSVWSTPLTGSEQENTVNAYYDGAGAVQIKLNNRHFDQMLWTPSVAVDVVSIGGPPNQTPGLRNGYFAGHIRNLRIQNKAISNAEYLATESGSYEQRELTPYHLTLVNPGAELGNTTGWTNEVGSLGVRNIPPDAFDGDYYFFAGPNAQTIARQRIDILSQTGMTASEIDAGDMWAKIRWTQSAWRGAPNPADDPGSMGIRTLSASQSQLTIGYSGIEAAPHCNTGGPWFWYCRSFAMDLPVGTRYLDALYRADRVSGTNNDFYADAIEVTVYRREN